MSEPVHIHPDNTRYFQFRNQPLALLCATEHYGSVLNRPFDFGRYLQEHARRKHTLTRLFLLFRELEAPNNPSSPCKPDSPDFVAPWPRTGPGRALDGELQFDLSRWNEEYLDRLHRFFYLASDLGIVIEATLFSNSYTDAVWALNPLRSENNIQGVGTTPFLLYNTLQDSERWRVQQEYVRKMVAELNAYDNFYWEVCNEPGSMDVEQVSPEAIDDWQKEVASAIRQVEEGLPQRHLVFGTQAFAIPPFRQENDASFRMGFDAVNVHPLPDTAYGGRTYQMGEFMSGQLKLSELRDFCLAVAHEPIPCVMDEDNAASCFRDTEGWTIHRKRAWTTSMCGSHYDVIDFSIVVNAEDGTEDSRHQIRSWIGYLSQFIHSLDFVHARPLGQWLLTRPDHLLESTLAVPGEDYAVYLADARERSEPGAGSALGGTIRLALPPGSYVARFYAPTTGEYSPGVSIVGGESNLSLPEFQDDIVVRISRLSGP